MEKHKRGCPRGLDPLDDCMCEFIKPKPRVITSKATNRAHIKKLALDYAATHNLSRFTRISQAFLDKIERNTVDFVKTCVEGQDRKGVTLR